VKKELLSKNCNNVETFVYDNIDLNTSFRKIRAGLFSFYNPFAASEFKRKIDDFRPDIIHVHNFFPQISPSIIRISSKRKIPVVMTLHNFRLLCVNGIFFRKGQICEKCRNSIFPVHGVIGRCYRNSMILSANIAVLNFFNIIFGTWRKTVDRYITLTGFQRDKILSSALNINKSKIVVKPNSISDPGEGSDERDQVFLFIGRLSKEKGIYTLIESLKFTSFKIKIFGDGPLRNYVKSKEKKSSNIKYMGFLKREAVFKELKKSQALIFPSICYEGFPIVLLEAFSTGTPVISSDIGSQAEIIQDGLNGFQFKAGDPANLAKKIEIFRKSDKQKFRKNARNTYIEKYTPVLNYKRLVEIYNEAINEKRTSSRD